MKITDIFVVLFALSAIAQGQWAAAARNFYQPILLSFGAAYSFISSDKVEADSFRWNEWVTAKFSKKDEGYEKYKKAIREANAGKIDESWKRRPDQSIEDFTKEIKEKVAKSSETEDHKKDIYEKVD